MLYVLVECNGESYVETWDAQSARLGEAETIFALVGATVEILAYYPKD